ncbi:long-chain fatty acid--CoA ligase [Aeromicrobium phragmitis]|uniref:Long-chain fatty acid--CoA ligase n=1 Tax=Aeromicrobium phragmitis TaxID=2478914 RepID=A0A3L8PKJ3_9ACTN|nr:AMP-binding protein [Aeromicrobium phragmitis]RLV54572.1 long-chain fatty acid--CoA ligase [Aeromicrobium phragmitis]
MKPWVDLYDVPGEVDIPDEPVFAAMDRAVKRWPERVAVDFLGATTTYAELAERIARGAAALRELGIGPGDRVSLAIPNSTSHVVAFYSVVSLGAIAVEHNPTYTEAELNHQLTVSGSTVVLAWQHIAERVVDAARGTEVREVVCVDIAKDLPFRSRLALKLPLPPARRMRAKLTAPRPAGTLDWHDLAESAGRISERPTIAATDPALFLYTGGTTGTPKAAILTHRNLVANVRQGAAWANFTEGTETVYGALPFFHAFGLTFCLTLPAHIGATVVAFPQFDTAMVLDALQRRPATFLPGVAPMFARLLEQAAATGATERLASIRLGFAGAMPITTEVVERWEAATGGLLIEGYGMTECSPIALGNPVSAKRRPGTLGLPFPNTEIKVDGEDGRGELLIRGPQVFAGYWQLPEETAQQLQPDGWLRTGDIVDLGEDHWVTLADRIKELILVGGFNVYPSQVEDVLRGMNAIEDVAVVGLPNGSDELVAAAVVVREGHHPPSLDEVRAHAEQTLPRYALPRRIVVVEELPRSQLGKVMRRLVRDQLVG